MFAKLPSIAASIPELPMLPDEPTTAATPSSMVATPSSTLPSPWERAKLAKLPSSKQHKITNAIVYHIIDDMRPFSTIESKSFRNILHACEPRYKPPSATSVSEQIVPIWHQLEKAKLQQELSDVKYVGLTSDGWTSRAVMPFETITVHFMKNWQLKAKVLQTEMMLGNHTGELLAAELTRSMQQWGLAEDKISAMTTDNASNITLACELAGCININIGCFAHTINLAAQKGNDTIKPVSKFMNPIITYFKKSCIGRQVLKEKQTALGLPLHDLISEVKTRWNSGYESKQRFMEQRPAIIAAFLDPRLVKQKDVKLLYADMSDANIRMCEEYVMLMKHMYDVTKAISSENTPTASLVLPLLTKLIKVFQPGPDDKGYCRVLKKAVSDNLVTRYQKTEVRHFLEEATALDPRTKQKSCIPPEAWERVLGSVTDIMVCLIKI